MASDVRKTKPVGVLSADGSKVKVGDKITAYVTESLMIAADPA